MSTPDSLPPLSAPGADVHGDGAAPWITPGERMGIGGCPVFPPDHVFRASVGSLPVHPRSDAMIAATGGSNVRTRAAFSSGMWQGSRNGIPTNVVDGRTAERVDVVVQYDFGGTGAHLDYPLPEEPRYEGWPAKAWDIHLLTVDSSTCESRELLTVREPADDPIGLGDGRYWAYSAGTFDLTSNEPNGWGSTASNTSLLSGMVRFDEVASGDIGHVIGATLGLIKAEERVWPAMGTDGVYEHPDAMPMGSWLRLRSDADLSALGPQARVVADAMMRHGVVIVDTGPDRLVLTGEPDLRWDDEDVATLGTLGLDDFDIIDASSMMVSPDSHQLRPTR